MSGDYIGPFKPGTLSANVPEEAPRRDSSRAGELTPGLVVLSSSRRLQDQTWPHVVIRDLGDGLVRLAMLGGDTRNHHDAKVPYVDVPRDTIHREIRPDSLARATAMRDLVIHT